MTKPDFSYEKKLWRKGFKFVVGVDEVGRGAWAGPVVAGAVVFSLKRGRLARLNFTAHLHSRVIYDKRKI